MNYKRIFGIGPVGTVITVLIWIIALYIGKWSGIPEIQIGNSLRWILLGLFMVDSVAMIVWSFIVLPPKKRGNNLIKSGPYQLVRHPIYSAIIWSGTGILAMLSLSWVVIISALPISILWSWLVQSEEIAMLEKFGGEYRDYMGKTGQFFPMLRREQKTSKRSFK